MKLKIKKQICKTKTKKGKCCKKHCEFDSDCCNIHKPKENCAICFNELKTLKKTKKLNCSHKFCNDCINKITGNFDCIIIWFVTTYCFNKITYFIFQIKQSVVLKHLI